MPTLTQSEIKGLFEFIPVVAALFRYRNGSVAYRPFLFFIWIGCLADIISVWASRYYHSNILIGNVYVLIEFCILLVFFSRVKGKINRDPFAFLFVVGVCVWIADNLIINTPFRVNSFFRIFYSLAIVLLSVQQLDHSVEMDEGITRNALLIAALSFIVYFSCKALIESFYFFNIHFSKAFYISLFRIMGWVNLFVNLVYTIVILCIPKKATSLSQ